MSFADSTPLSLISICLTRGARLAILLAAACGTGRTRDGLQDTPVTDTGEEWREVVNPLVECGSHSEGDCFLACEWVYAAGFLAQRGDVFVFQHPLPEDAREAREDVTFELDVSGDEFRLWDLNHGSEAGIAHACSDMESEWLGSELSLEGAHVLVDARFTGTEHDCKSKESPMFAATFTISEIDLVGGAPYRDIGPFTREIGWTRNCI